MKKIKKLIILPLILMAITLSMGAKTFNATPQEVYRVYLGAQQLGLVKSKADLEKYIA